MSNALLLLPDFLLIAVGFVLCRFTALNRPVWEAAERLVYYLLFPVLLFNSILKSPLQPAQTVSLAAAGVATMACGIVLALALKYWPGVDARLHASGAQVAFRFNSFIALALSERLGGPQALAWTALMIALCVPLANIAAVWPLARHGGHPYGRELLRNPLIVSTLGGLVANVAGLHLPDAVSTTLQRIGLAALPLGLMAVGAGLRLGGAEGLASLGRGPAEPAPCGAADDRDRPHVGAAAGAARRAAQRGGDVRRTADRIQRLRARRAHGRRRQLRGRAGNGIHLARHLLGMVSVPLWLAVLAWLS